MVNFDFGRFAKTLGATLAVGLPAAVGTGYFVGTRPIPQQEVSEVQESCVEAPRIVESPLEAVAQETKAFPEKVETNLSYANAQRDSNSSVVTKEYMGQMIALESSGNPKARSPVGARGLVQIMPATWSEQTKKLYGKSIDFERAFEPELNVEVGTAYAKDIEKYLSKRIEGWNGFSVEKRQDLIIAAYNGGMGRLANLEGDISKMPKESRDHVQKLHNLRKKN